MTISRNIKSGLSGGLLLDLNWVDPCRIHRADFCRIKLAFSRRAKASILHSIMPCAYSDTSQYTSFLGQPNSPTQDCWLTIKVATNILKQSLHGSEINQLKILFCQTNKQTKPRNIFRYWLLWISNDTKSIWKITLLNIFDRRQQKSKTKIN